jgi:Restriction endonuclease
MDRLDFDGLDPTEFEEFCFELLRGLPGFTNVDWRKGTGLAASPADRGRDIVAEVERTDVDGARHSEQWFVDCKHYKRGVPPSAIQSLLAWAAAERPHVVLVIASNALSNPTKDYLADYERNNRPSFRIKYWERPILEKLTEGKPELLERFLVSDTRSQSEIIAAEEEFFDKVWYDRHLGFRHAYESGDRANTPTEIYEQAVKAAEEVRKRWGDDDLGPYSDFEWGMVNGKLSALRWVLGDDWDFLDT